MQILILALILGLPTSRMHSQPATCNVAGGSQRTHWGHQYQVFDFQSRPVRSLKGSIQDIQDKPVEGVLVEVYARQAKDPSPVQQDSSRVSETRLFACVTGASGLYSFDLPSGYYELRSSKPDWNSTSVLIRIDPQNGQKKETRITLEVGT